MNTRETFEQIALAHTHRAVTESDLRDRMRQAIGDHREGVAMPRSSEEASAMLLSSLPGYAATVRTAVFTFVALLSTLAHAQCRTGNCSSGGGSAPPTPTLGHNPSAEQLTAAGYVRTVEPSGRVMWYQTKPGVAADARGRNYPVPVRAAAKAFAGWAAAPRLRPVTRLAPVGEDECEDGSCASDSADAPSAPASPGGAAGKHGPPGPAGPAGPKGDKGDAGEVDYEKVQDMIASVVAQSVSQTLSEMQPMLEENIAERLAADPRMRGQDGQPGKDGRDVTQLSDAELDALAAQIASRLPGITFHKRDESGKVTDSETVPLGGQLFITGKLLNAAE